MRRHLDITSEHPEFAAARAQSRMYRDLYLGGEQLRKNARFYLRSRQKEPVDVYEERLSRVFYENYIGSIIDWYAATLFRREPVLTFEGENQTGKKFFAEFAEDCDLKGTTLTAMLRKQFVSALVHGRSYLLIDFPKQAGPLRTKAEEESLGVSRAYLVDYDADELINWSTDSTGMFEWVVLRTAHSRPPQTAKGAWGLETRWNYFDQERYEVWSASTQANEKHPVLIDEGFHGLASLGRVPLFELKLSEGLWLMHKACHLQLEHFNKSNALSWALTMGLFAMPVVYSDRDWKQIVGESYYIQLGQQDRFGWTEPEGKVYQVAAENLTRLQEEIYRVCYLLHQARGLYSNGFSQSGLSKQRDFAITQEVLRAYGDVVKDYLKRLLKAINAARQDSLVIDVAGMDDFDIGEFSTDLADAERLLSLGVESPTLKATIFKKLAAKYLCDARQEVKDRINEEIDRAVGLAGR
ncbi:MAG: hypothetical protein NZV14_08010 [Bryobacteraceae bacterium]|nr:hypothetical protein [Bryobacteraceae bacterium]MDW8378091.1 hypothetical protein [Bryobacterales bacterium]